MKLEDLVPSYTLCEMIPRGEFGDSAFVWLKRRRKHVAIRKPCMGQSIPAPTLAEILQKLEIEACKSVFWGYSEAREFRGDHSLGEAVSFALETWFMQEEEKRKMNCLECNFARKFPGDCKYVVCERFGGFRRVDGGCHETFGTNGERLKALDNCQRARFYSIWGCPPVAKCGVDGCKACWKKWFESPADMEFWRNFEGGKANDED